MRVLPIAILGCVVAWMWLRAFTTIEVAPAPTTPTPVHAPSDFNIAAAPHAPLSSVAVSANVEAAWRIDTKYLTWLDESRIEPTALAEVRDRLIAREAIANDYERPDRDAQLARMDAWLQDTLHPDDFAQYTLLKDADASLQSLDNFRQGLAWVQPLSDAQMAALVRAKLRQVTLTRMAPQAADQAMIDFLNEATVTLTFAQWQHLNDFERTEFDRWRHAN